ncbi:MAG: hypothetical protein A2W90_05860 [Bacteroidetes bacterium GWF2_42_66]|nr:MAG: hypothetical protein A2W92_01240 [Bacteroidetes bacterium GWA2_42_15]OFY03569.1 MAG: hypothetical protein A2W89_18585 [Bacteroidetes bacterium GWE2_42_39]OFY45934.1 MAG: hypothetical protein A2W90_05860 [Bacteroidetes bacterium GWF2_42_66]HBL75176.1 hypothetical protein [Prolixibacteraceae bacterium]HCR89727.1 hypothetical protein [Prolixibacteraceae bacterium]
MSDLKIIFLLIFLLSAGSLFAQTSTIKGVASEYAGMEMPVYTYSDFISEEKVEVGKIHFQADGSFSAGINLPCTMVCFTELDIHQGMIYVEQGKSYEIQFPPRQKQSEAQKRNPFFSLLPVWLKILNQQNADLNLLIKNFETEFRVLEDKHFYNIYEKRSKASVELVKTELQKKFPKTENRFFEDHKKYRIGNLEYALNQGKSIEFVNYYFGKVSPKMQIPAYVNLFNQVFANYFSFLGNSVHDQKITGLVNSGDIRALEEYLSEKNGWNTDACQLVILKSLKDAYYSGQFSKTSVAGALAQVADSNWPDKYKLIAKNIWQKITYLLPGTKAPELQLTRINGQKTSPGEFCGSFVYLHFTDLQNPVCRQHMEALKPIADQYKTNLTVIFITEGKTPETEARKWTGVFTTTTDEGKAAYKVKTFPSSYLLGRDGKLAASPALNPLNGFESQLRQILEKERIKKLKGKQLQ